jgi:hypothetical protein
MQVYSVLTEHVCPDQAVQSRNYYSHSVFRQKYFPCYLKKNGTGRKPDFTGEEFILSQSASFKTESESEHSCLFFFNSHLPTG